MKIKDDNELSNINYLHKNEQDHATNYFTNLKNLNDKNASNSNKRISNQLRKRLSDHNLYKQTEEKLKNNNKIQYTLQDLKNNNFTVIESHVKLKKSNLNYQNILKIEKIEVDETKKTKEICLIYEDSEKLIDYLLKTRLNFKARLMIILDIALGIKALHYCNIAHTNIKIDNIMKCKDCFKISNLEHAIDFSNPLPKGYRPVNSECYAPEYYYKREPIGISVDIWNFGLLYFQLITGNSTKDILINCGPNSILMYEELMYNKINFVEYLNDCIDYLRGDDYSYDWKTIKKILIKIYANCTKCSDKRSKIQEIIDNLYNALDKL
eukprot:Mrub_05791.p1 GENE.Mrub_05791~~Mrub_05791.p1  ORF type:complete len:345 (+),score=39.14 Mrub_05791:66-1037(+)